MDEYKILIYNNNTGSHFVEVLGVHSIESNFHTEIITQNHIIPSGWISKIRIGWVSESFVLAASGRTCVHHLFYLRRRPSFLLGVLPRTGFLVTTATRFLATALDFLADGFWRAAVDYGQGCHNNKTKCIF